ncbi:hypothetical protein XYCOK13_24380 [Xylanibacillus composti]|uniref:Uncharacterized protein n=1 Tax=Xylanibacillus composti TaxID=1572762 RepID=A0A8J4H2C8_9BACL|nr:hypothetical protein [Xylanibacillus composti]GIQ69614.1 hypothetical protein XYCOK13_24380 [Xylanibacillus composti]
MKKWFFGILILLLFISGGLSYWNWSSEGGYATPLEAVHAFRSYKGTLIHEHDVDGGKVLFLHRGLQVDEWNFQAEYVKETRRGWIWGYGGGHSAAFGDHPPSERWSYQYFPSTKGTPYESPFPMLYGLMDSAHHTVSVHSHTTGENYRTAGLHVDQLGVKLWYFFLTEGDGQQFTLTFLSEKNEVMDTMYIDESKPANGGNVGKAFDRLN